jgi:hypothetical protein
MSASNACHTLLCWDRLTTTGTSKLALRTTSPRNLRPVAARPRTPEAPPEPDEDAALVAYAQKKRISKTEVIRQALRAFLGVED